MLNGCAYILTVDVGNTFIRFGLFAEDSAAAQECPLATCEITTPSSITADEARMRLMQVMGALAADAGVPGVLAPAAAVLSCVVPALERPWKAALSRTCTGRVLTVGPGLKTGIPVHYDDPAEIGPDRIADAVAARAVYGSPCIVIDLGTTTNIEVIDVHGTFVGGVIAPGLALGARSLSAAAAWKSW
jgi:pantothenate kinase type III